MPNTLDLALAAAIVADDPRTDARVVAAGGVQVISPFGRCILHIVHLGDQWRAYDPARGCTIPCADISAVVEVVRAILHPL